MKAIRFVTRYIPDCILWVSGFILVLMYIVATNDEFIIRGWYTNMFGEHWIEMLSIGYAVVMKVLTSIKDTVDKFIEKGLRDK